MDARYRRWDGSQEPFGEPPDVGEVLDDIGDEMLAGFGGRAALRRLQREGLGQRRGLDDLLGRLRDRRRRLRAEIDPDGSLAEIQRELDDIVRVERLALADTDGDEARLAELALDGLPRDPAGRMRELSRHDFASPEAARRLEALRERLRRELLDAYLRDATAALESAGAEDIRALTDMLADLNAMLDARDRGDEYDFEAFMQRHGHHFPEEPSDLDELLAVLGRRMAAMSRLLASMSDEQRRRLRDLARSVFDDLDLEFELDRLGAHLRSRLPGMDWDTPVDGGAGAPPGPLGGLVDSLERLGELDALVDQLDMAHAGASLEDVDEDALRRHLGDDAAGDLRALRRIERELEEAGVMRRTEGELELTPRGARLLGERALTRLLERIPRRSATEVGGAQAEPTGQTRRWRFGDTERIATRPTITNAVLRQAGEGGPAVPVHLTAEDFAVEETEVRPRTATVLLLDLSFSMPLQGHFVPAKRMALALHALVEGRHRQDSMHLVGFSDYARRMQPADLAAAGFERVYGTNMHHAFLLARRILSRDPRPAKQAIMVTDGEPTAHLEGEESVFSWPPVPETLEATLREAMRLARSGITLHVFMLEDDPGLLAFAERLADVTDGEVMQMDAERIGRHVLRGYA